MKKVIQILIIIILVMILSLIIVLVFNPFNLRTKFIASVLNSYLSSTIEDYTPLEIESKDTQSTTSNSSTQVEVVDKNPLLNDGQEKALESYGVNVEQLPKEITSGMETCFVEKLGQARADQLIAGDTPSAMEVFKAKECLSK